MRDIERNRGNWDVAETLYRQSLAVRTELGDSHYHETYDDCHHFTQVHS
ncbi:MAG: hypothetical protein V7L20_18215 [Nostoc sp.]